MTHRRLRIKHSETLPFREYAERAFARLGLEHDVTEEEVRRATELVDSHWKAVVGCYVMRLALAPLVEAYVLLDRMIYLYERGEESIRSRSLSLTIPNGNSVCLSIWPL